MTNAKAAGASWFERLDVIHAVRTTIAAVLSMAGAQALKLPEPYWAPITAIVVMQSTLGAALKASSQRFVGTALGCAMGALVTTYLQPNLLWFGTSVFVLGIICALLKLHHNAYRFAGISAAIVMLIEHTRPPRYIAAHRFVEVSFGIAVALLLSAVWPEPESPLDRSA
jgi:uncharacterized membrane protein YccC